MKPIQIAAILLGLLLPAPAQNKPSGKITGAELKAVINNPNGDVAWCESLDQISLEHLEYHDFTGDGQDEAIVIASTCNTGTAGPDIHSVFTRGAGGNVVELPFKHIEGDPFFNGTGWKIPVFGNANYTLTLDHGLLMASWKDSSDRKEPLTAWYKWDGHQFVLDHKKVEGPFTTSYDCSKAAKEIDRAICYSPSVAALDVQLGRTYRQKMQQILPVQKPELLQQQRAWLAQREKQCTIYKWWVDCLTDLYKKRIEELQQPSSGSAGAGASPIRRP